MRQNASLTAVALMAATLFAAACGADDDGGERAASETTAAGQVADPQAAGPDGGRPVPRTGPRGRSAPPPAGARLPTPTTTHKVSPGIEITTGDSPFGEALFDGDRRAIYFFDRETSGHSECYGRCAAAWPPVLTDGEPVAGGGADSKLLGVTRREDGSTQVTPNGRALPYYVDDPPGQILCHNVAEFGGLWLAVLPGGEAFG